MRGQFQPMHVADHGNHETPEPNGMRNQQRACLPDAFRREPVIPVRQFHIAGFRIDQAQQRDEDDREYHAHSKHEFGVKRACHEGGGKARAVEMRSDHGRQARYGIGEIQNREQQCQRKGDPGNFIHACKHHGRGKSESCGHRTQYLRDQCRASIREARINLQQIRAGAQARAGVFRADDAADADNRKVGTEFGP